LPRKYKKKQLKPASSLVFGSSQIYLAEISLLSIALMNSEVPARFSAKLWAYFAGLEAKLLGALAPFGYLKKYKKAAKAIPKNSKYKCGKYLFFAARQV